MSRIKTDPTIGHARALPADTARSNGQSSEQVPLCSIMRQKSSCLDTITLHCDTAIPTQINVSQHNELNGILRVQIQLPPTGVCDNAFSLNKPQSVFA